MTIKKASMLVLALVCLLQSFAFAVERTRPIEGKLIYQSNRYLLGPGDVLSLKVLHEPDYNQSDILVSPDGFATIVGVGDMDLTNRTIKDVQDEIQMRLKRYIVEPHVLLTLTRTKPGMVYLAGAVMHPGMVQFATSSGANAIHVNSIDPLTRTEMRLTNLLSNAGGVSPNADLSRVQVTKISTGEAVTVNLWELLRDGKSQNDVVLNSGDTVFVPFADEMAMDDDTFRLLMKSSLGPKDFKVRMLGEVKMPGVYALEADSPYLNSAIAKSNGMTVQANNKVVAIRRFTDESHFSTLMVDPRKNDVMLRPNDIVYVAENKLYKSGRMMQEVAKVLSPFQTLSSTGSYSAQTFGIGGWRRLRY